VTTTDDDVDFAPAPSSGLERLLRHAFAPPEPLARIAVLRTVISVFVVYDTFWIVDDVIPHATGPQNLYSPLILREWLHLPVPNPTYAYGLHALIIVAAAVVAVGRLPRLAGVLLAAAFTDWVSIGMSYGKVDHDHFALIVATWVLPTVGAARWRDRGRTEAAGWALLCLQTACVATYFLSAWAKMRYGGRGWANGSVFAWAIVRRGTSTGDLLLQAPWLLRLSQWGLLVMEFCSPLLLLIRHRWRWLALGGFGAFHLVTYLTIKIHFLPLLVCLLAFLPVERAVPTGVFSRRPGR
jgi:hypothetical protein